MIKCLGVFDFIRCSITQLKKLGKVFLLQSPAQFYLYQTFTYSFGFDCRENKNKGLYDGLISF